MLDVLPCLKKLINYKVSLLRICNFVRNDLFLLAILFVEHGFEHGFGHDFDHGFEHGFEHGFKHSFIHGFEHGFEHKLKSEDNLLSTKQFVNLSFYITSFFKACFRFYSKVFFPSCERFKLRLN